MSAANQFAPQFPIASIPVARSLHRTPHVAVAEARQCQIMFFSSPKNRDPLSGAHINPTDSAPGLNPFQHHPARFWFSHGKTFRACFKLPNYRGRNHSASVA